MIHNYNVIYLTAKIKQKLSKALKSLVLKSYVSR